MAGFPKVLRNTLPFRMLRGVVSEWRAAGQLAQRSFSMQYRRSRFGFLWEVLDPLLIAGIFIALAELRGITVLRTGLPYALFVVTGMMLWQTFQDGIDTGLRCIVNQKQLLSSLKIKPELLVLTSLYSVAFSTLFRIVVALGAIILFLGPTPMGLVFLGAFPLMIMLGLGIGLTLAPFATINGDIKTVTGFVTRPLMFLSSVVIPLPVDGHWLVAAFRQINPMALIIENARSILSSGRLIDGGLIISATITLAALVFLFGWYCIHVSLPLVGDQN